MREILAAIQAMPTHTATGPDAVEVAFLRHLSAIANRCLPYIVNRNWRDAVVPAAWREVLLIGIPRPSESTALRLLSVSSMVNRGAEQLDGLRLTAWMKSIVPERKRGSEGPQHAGTHCSRGRHVCSTRTMCCIICGLQCRVAIPSLLAKMTSLQCEPNVLCWMQSYLTDRRASGLHISSVGHSRVLGCVLPQGRSLSPSLWNVFILDLVVRIHDVVQFSFADDTSFHVCGKNWEDVISERNDTA